MLCERRFFRLKNGKTNNGSCMASQWRRFMFKGVLCFQLDLTSSVCFRSSEHERSGDQSERVKHRSVAYDDDDDIFYKTAFIIKSSVQILLTLRVLWHPYQTLFPGNKHKDKKYILYSPTDKEMKGRSLLQHHSVSADEKRLMMCVKPALSTVLGKVQSNALQYWD